MSTTEQQGEPSLAAVPSPSSVESTADIITFRRGEDDAFEDGTFLPVRYDVRDGEHGRYLRCKEAPGIAVALDRSYAFTEAEARKLGERVVLLDGAGQFAPLIDNGRQLYNLDHHEACLRAFTLATCEQALVLVLKGLELDKGDWRLIANEPDLDTIFAIWVLLNYRRLRDMDAATRDRIAPLLRLEGAIDANGYEIAAYCGLSQKVMEDARAKLDILFARELALKREGAWADVDLAEYTREQLVALDHLVFQPSDFEDFDSVEEELGHVDIGKGRVAVVVRDGAGIYEVEKRLKRTWSDRLGIIALAKDASHYTLRRVASLADIDLTRAYDRLNQLDPAVDGRPPEKLWGGSDDIGGSPRPGGTGLEPKAIVDALRLAYRPLGGPAWLRKIGLVTLLAAVLAGAGWAAGMAYEGLVSVPSTPRSLAAQLGAMAAVMAIGAWLATLIASHGRTWLHGWRWPAGERWVLALPLVIAGASCGGVWIPRRFAWDAESLALSIGATLLMALALELGFRGLIHGLLASEAPTQLLRGRWFVSQPALVSALLYAAATVVLCGRWFAGPPPFWGVLEWLAGPILVMLGAFAVGLGLALIRERSLSLIPAVLAMLVACGARLAFELV